MDRGLLQSSATAFVIELLESRSVRDSNNLGRRAHRSWGSPVVPRGDRVSGIFHLKVWRGNLFFSPSRGGGWTKGCLRKVPSRSHQRPTGERAKAGYRHSLD